MAMRVIRMLAPVAVLAISIGLYMVLQATRPLPQQKTEEVRLTRVNVVAAALQDTRLAISTQGEVRARTAINLVSQVNGRVVSVSPEFVEGGRVEPGVVLLQIEGTDYKLALAQARARVAEADLAVQQALADSDVARKQLRNTVNPSELALKKPQATQAKTRRAAAIADLEQAKLNLERTRVTLPFAGRVATTTVDIGQFISAGTVLAQVFGTEVVEIRLPMNNSQLAALGLPIGYIAEPGEAPTVSFSADVAGRRHHWNGKLVRLDASVDPDTRMLYGIAELTDPYGQNVSASGMPMAVGLYVDAAIEGRALSGALSIPRAGLRAGNIVYLLDSGGRLVVRPVEVVHASDTRAIIASGLVAGDQVITSAIRNPIAGMALTAIKATARGN
jgi:RND family efflux transporter MFP subunit